MIKFLANDQALSKIGTPEYSGVDGLIKRVKETSAEIRNAAPNSTTLPIQGKAHVNLTPTHMNSGYKADKPEIKRMVFVNEKIPEQDRAKFESIINYENLKKQAQYIPEFQPKRLPWWTIDRERGVYVLGVTGGARTNALLCVGY